MLKSKLSFTISFYITKETKVINSLFFNLDLYIQIIIIFKS
jgi:hypothetical protein